MTLKDKIDNYKQQSAGKASKDMVATMTAATKAVQESIANRNILAVGEPLPDFSLADSNGNIVQSQLLFQKGPLAITFFRGMW